MKQNIPSRLIIKLTILSCLVISGCGEKSIDEQVRKALLHIEQGNTKVASLELENILRKHPGEEAILFELNKIYTKDRNYRKTVKLLAQPIAQGLDSRELIYSYTDALINLAYFEQAIALINKHKDLFETAQGYALTGHGYSGLNQNKQAITFFQKALGLDENSISARLGLAQEAIMFSEGNKEQQILPRNLQDESASNETVAADVPLSIEDAKAHLEKVLKLEPDNIVANYLSGMIYYLEDNMIEAQSHINRVLKVDPDHKESLLLIGRFHLEMGHLKKSEEILNHYLNLQPDDLKARMLLASIMLRNQQPEKALELLAAYSDVGNDDPEYLLIVGNAYLAMANYDLAVENFQNAEAILPESVLVKMYSAMAYLARSDQKKNDRENSISLLEEVLQIEPENSQAGISLATTYLQSGEFQKAEGVATNLIKNFPDLPVPWYLSGLAWQGMGNTTNAIMAFENTLEKNRGFIPATIRLAKIYQQLGEDELVLKNYNTTLESKPYNSEILTEMAIFEQNRGNVKKAVELLELARNRNPTALSPRLLLGTYYLRRGHIKLALQLADEMYKIAPRRVDVLLYLGQVKLATGRSSEAVSIFAQLLKGQQNSPEILSKYGSALNADGRIEEARTALKSAIDISKGNLPEALIELARLELSAENFDQVKVIVDDLLKNFPDLISGRVLEADLAMKQENFEDAISSYQQALKHSDNTELVLKLYQAYLKTNRNDEATALIEKASQQKADDLRLGMTWADIQHKAGDTGQAIRTYNALLEIYPNNALILNNLAWLYDETDRSKALSYAEKAYKETPNIPQIIDSYGWFCLLDGRVMQSLELLEMAVKKSPAEPEFHYHLAAVQIKLGKDSSARKSLERALSTDKEFNGRSEAEKLMQKLNQSD